MTFVQKGAVIVGLAVGLGTTMPSAQGEMPITTASQEARQLYVRALDKSENIEVEAAAALLEQAIAKDPAFAMAYLLRAQSGGGFNVSRENLEKAVSLADKVSAGERHWILAAKAQSDSDSIAAKRHLDALLAAFPSDKRVQSRLGFYYRGTLGDNATAATYFKKAIQIDPAYAAAHNNLGYALSAVGDYAGAEAAFKKYITLMPDRPNPYDSYAELLMKMGRHDESIAQYKTALDKDGAFIGSLVGIGTNLVFKKDYEGGRSWYQKELAKASNPNAKLDAMGNIALSYVHEGNTGLALKTFDEIAVLGRSSNLPTRTAGAHFDATFVLLEAGRADEAERHLAEAKKTAEGASLPAPVKERLGIVASLLRARVLGAQGKFDEAGSGLTETATAIARRGNPFEEQRLNEVRGIVAVQQKRYEAALGLLAKADQANPYAIYYQAVANEKLGKTAESSALFKKVATWNENDLGYSTVRARALAKIGS